MNGKNAESYLKLSFVIKRQEPDVLIMSDVQDARMFTILVILYAHLSSVYMYIYV